MVSLNLSSSLLDFLTSLPTKPSSSKISLTFLRFNLAAFLGQGVLLAMLLHSEVHICTCNNHPYYRLLLQGVQIPHNVHFWHWTILSNLDQGLTRALLMFTFTPPYTTPSLRVRLTSQDDDSPHLQIHPS